MLLCLKVISLPTLFIMANALHNIYRLAGPVAVGAMLFNASLYDVKGGSRAVIFDRLSGVQEQVVNEGTHLLVPWLQRAIIYDVRTKPRNISTTTGSKDLQMVTLTLRVLHRPEVPRLPQIYQVRAILENLLDLELTSCLTVIWYRLRRACSPLHRKRSPQSHCGPVRRRRADHTA